MLNDANLLAELVQAIEARLETLLPRSSTLSQELVDAMRYAVLQGGKRLRGSFVCATAYTLSGSYKRALDSACALECAHAYSLVHDDLPVMDDADWRRGKPSCHKVYGPGMATLVGDALQPFAFHIVLTCDALSESQSLAIGRVLSHALGWEGMVGGQAWDVGLTANSDLSLDELRCLHAAKSGELFSAAIQIGLIVGDPNVSAEASAGLGRFAARLGEAFQVIDDVLDQSQPCAVTGKPQGQDERLGKRTFPVIMGTDDATKYAHTLLEDALAELTILGYQASPLAELAKNCVERIK